MVNGKLIACGMGDIQTREFTEMSKQSPRFPVFLIFLTFLILMGCSGGGLIEPASDQAEEPRIANPGQTADYGRTLWGVWDLTFDESEMKIVPLPNRSINPHFNVTEKLNPPECADCLQIDVLEFKPVQKYVKLNATVKNPTSLTGFDVRGIVISNAGGLKLVNADAYTGLWDDGGDVTLNPFRTFATDQFHHQFFPWSTHEVVYEIRYSAFIDLLHTALVVDASWPFNCREPYAIGEYTQTDPIITYGGGSTDISVNVYDWQFNAENVTLNATSIGGGIIELAYTEGYEWSGTLEIEQENPPGEYELLVSAGSAGTNLKLHNYFTITINACAPDGNETWQTSEELPIGSNSGERVVCDQNEEDWYDFLVTSKPGGSIDLDQLNYTGTIDLALFGDPESDPLIWKVSEDGSDISMDLGPYNLDVGKYYLLVRHVGDDIEGRKYTLYNNAQLIPCTEEGNETYETGTLLPFGENSGPQVVCIDDKQDWYKFDSLENVDGTIRLSVTNDTGQCDLALYKAPDVENYLLWKSGSFGQDVVFNLSPLNLEPGIYYLRVRHLGGDEWVRQYALYNNAWPWACNPDGNEDWGNAVELPVGDSASGEDVCEYDLYDWYQFDVDEHLYGDIRLTLENDTGAANLYFYSDPDDFPVESAVATYGSDAVINTSPYNFVGGIYYILVEYTGDDHEARIYTLHNDTKDSFCYPDGVDSYDTSMELIPGTNSGAQYVCLDDKQDWYRLSLTGSDDGLLKITVTNATGPVDMTLYNASQAPDPGGPHLAWKQADPQANIDLDSLGLTAGSYYLRVRHIGVDELVRLYLLESVTEQSGWALTFGGNGHSPNPWDSVQGVDVDDYGNIYCAGLIVGPGDLDPGPGVEPYTPVGATDAYIIKLNSKGEFQWGYGWGNAEVDYVDGVVLDDFGNAYVYGKFNGVVDFDPGIGIDEGFSTDYSHHYIVKYSASGEFLGVLTLETVHLHADTDSYGNLYIGGTFAGTVDFDPGPGINEMTANGSEDIFLLKLDPGWNFQWAFNIGGDEEDPSHRYDNCFAVLVDIYGDVCIGGRFTGKDVDFDPGPGEDLHTSKPYIFDIGMVVAKYNPSGGLLWARDWEAGYAGDYQLVYDLACNSLGNIYATGTFTGTKDFDPGPDVDDQHAKGKEDFFLSKFTSDGDYQWAKTWGGIDREFFPKVEIDDLDNVYISGYCESYSIDCDPGPGEYLLGGNDWWSILSKFGGDDSFQWASSLNPVGFSGLLYCYDIACDGTSAIYMGGAFMDECDLEPGPGVTLFLPHDDSKYYFDAYLVKVLPNGTW